MFETALTRQLGIRVPIVQAPIGGIASSALAAAVSNAGGLGMLSGTWHQPALLRELIHQTQASTNMPFGVNFVLAFNIAENLQVCLDAGVKIVSFFWGDPSPFITTVHAAGGVVLQTVASAEESCRMASLGVDVLVAQGVEAGGHVWGEVSSFALIPTIADAVPQLPVIAAGGIADGRGLAAALCLGASGVWMGTRFVATHEANAHPVYQQALLKARETSTTYEHRLFNVGWDFAPHRALKNSTYQAWLEAGQPEVGQRPGEGDVVSVLANGQSLVRYADDAPTRAVVRGDPEAQALYAGQSVGLIRRVESVGDVIRQVQEQASGILKHIMT
jgi:nitronate monooxygenase